MSSTPSKTGVSFYFLAIFAAFLLMAGLISFVSDKTDPGAVAAERAELRRKNLEEIRKVEQQGMSTYGWVDKDKGVVRIPVEKAMDLSVAEWKNPEAARKDLLARAEKAFFVPPPAPEAPSDFE